MNTRCRTCASCLLGLSAVFALAASAWARPYEAGKFQGRIAWSSDGNHNDPDDWAASPVALAIFAEAGLKDRLVHFDYNSILTQTDPEWEKKHADSVLGAAREYGYDPARFFDCRKNLDGALADLAAAINASSAADPLYLIIAGPMEVPFRAIEKADPAKRQFVYCISHSRWNDGYSDKYKFTFTKRSVIEQDVHWTQICDQNERLSFGRYGRPASPEEFAPYFWMRDSRDAKVRFLWDRMVVSTRPDPSDAGMAWFLATGDQECDPAKLQRLLDGHQVPPPVIARPQVRLEAENFRHLDGCVVEDRNNRDASHRLNLRLADGVETARPKTRFDEPFAAASGRYDVLVRYSDEKDRRARFALFVNGEPRGAAWESAGAGRGWTTQTLSDVALATGDELRLDVQGRGARVDYVQLNARETRGAGAAAQGAPLKPVIAGEWRRICEMPDLGDLNAADPKRHNIVDHGFIRATSGQWQLWACMRGVGVGRLLYGWQGESLEKGPWKPIGVVARAEKRFGEKVEEKDGKPVESIQAPYFMRDGDRFYCFYTSAGCRAMESTDGVNYKRCDFGGGRGNLLFPDSGRDVMILKIRGLYHAYSTITTLDKKSYVQLKTSADLLAWSKPKVVSRGGKAGNDGVASESPFVVERDGWFYLFRASSTTFRTYVYRSPDPTDFGIDDDKYLIAEFAIKAPEIIRDGDKEYISDLADFRGIKVAPLRWEKDDRTPSAR